MCMHTCTYTHVHLVSVTARCTVIHLHIHSSLPYRWKPFTCSNNHPTGMKHDMGVWIQHASQ